jgi:bacterioferritin (cytochrome b1)
VDARLHYLQGETDDVNPAELLAFLNDFHRETLELFKARLSNAQSVAAYDANNGFQQVLGRQEVHLQWLRDGIAALGATVADSLDQVSGKASPETAKSIIDADAASQKAFIDRWAPHVAKVTNARHRKMLELILGEMKEHLRVLQQAADDRADLLGRHSDGKVLRGTVMAARPKN